MSLQTRHEAQYASTLPPSLLVDRARSFHSPPAGSGRHLPLAARFGLRLRTLRRAKGMTQLQVAVEFGIDRTFISDLERGRKSVSLPFIEVFALGFGMSLSELLSDL